MATDKFRNKYRIASARLQNWDYGSNASYFVTICTADREAYFGIIEKAKFIPTELGNVAHYIWNEIPKQFPYAKLGAFVLMPNHIHGIIIINKSNDGNTTTDVNKLGGITGNKNPMLHDNLSRIVRWYKGRVTFELRKINPNFGWQSRFYDHIIRNHSSFLAITKYIHKNVLNWDKDKFYSQ